MKLSQLLLHLPSSQIITIIDHGEEKYHGFPDTNGAHEYASKTVGLISVDANHLEINVFDR